jgi:hypothetical protein
MDKDAVNLAKAIRRAETGGSSDPYNAKGASGEYGAYQFMPKTWQGWSKQYLGQENAPMSVANQNKVAYLRIKELKDQGLTPAQIASSWNSGGKDTYKTTGEAAKSTNDQGVDYDVPAYVKKVSQNYRAIAGKTETAEAAEIGTTQPPRRRLEDLKREQAEAAEKQGITDPKKTYLPQFQAEADQPVRNFFRTLGNIPSSALNLAKNTIAPVNPFDLNNPMNIGSNIVKSAGALKNIVTEQKPVEALKNIYINGPLDVAKKGLGIVSNASKAVDQSVQQRGLGGAIVEGASKIAEAGIEDPLLIPSLIYAPSKIRGTGVTTDTISGTANLVKKPIKAVTAPVVKAFEPTTKALEKKVVQQFQKGVKPRINMNMTPNQATKFEGDIVEATKVISKNKDKLKFVDDAGEEIVGRTPETLQELGDALDQTKKFIFSEYDALAQKAGKGGLKINTNPIADELSEVISNEALQITNPTAIKYAEELQARLSFRELDAKTAQDVIQNYNESLKAFYRNPSYDTASKASIDAFVVNKMRQQLDEGITNLTGVEYQALKNQYGSLKAVEKDIMKAALRDARKNNIGLIDYTDIFTAGDLVSGILTFNPAQITRGIGARTIKEVYKYLNSPNRAVKKMFESTNKLNKKPLPYTPPKTANATKPTKPTNPNANAQTKPKTANLKGESDANMPMTNKNAANHKNNSNIPTSKPLDAKKSSKGVDKSTPNKQGGFISTGYKPADLSTKILKKLEGKTVVNKQFISDLTNSGDIKQVEKELIREVLGRFEDGKVSVDDFGKAVEAELLPLTVNKARDMYSTARGSSGGRYENIALPDDLRGNVKNYEERIYESPIKTSAGNIHFGQPKDKVEGYFGHTRVEDMADDQTRRLIEVQSDLFQKGNLEREGTGIMGMSDDEIKKILPKEEFKELLSLKEKYKNAKTSGERLALEQRQYELRDKAQKEHPRTKEVAKLAQYNNPTAHFRMLREEVKKAAQDGKTKLQIPTGETAMKVEGLGVNADNWLGETGRTSNRINVGDLSVGKEIARVGEQEKWIITDVLGDGKFKAVPSREFDTRLEGVDGLTYKEQINYASHHKPEIFDSSETFDISGKVDKENPIYKFYEKDLARYAKGKYNAKPVTDKKGVTWLEIDIKPEMADESIEAFGKVGMNPLFVAGAGAAGIAGGAKLYKEKKNPNLPKSK